MMKKIVVFAITLVLSLSFVVSAFATVDRNPLFVDGAGLVTKDEAKEISKRLEEISEKNNYDVVIYTVDSFEGDDPRVFAADFFEAHYGYGTNKTGTILLISMEERDWALVSHGEGIDKIPDIYALDGYFLDYLSNDEYAQAFMCFADEVESCIEFQLVPSLIMSVIIGFIVAFVVTAIMKGKLKTVKSCDNAREYVRKGSFDLKHSRDLYLYSTVTRVARPKNNSSGGGNHGGFRSSSGGSFSGSRGKF